jgi:hypothetical protein
MAYVLIRFFHSSEDPIERTYSRDDPPQTSGQQSTRYTDLARTLAAELQKLAKKPGIILDATPKENIFEVTFIQPLCTIQATEGASSPALFEREQYSCPDNDTQLYQDIEQLPKADLGGELDNLKGSDGTFDLVYMKEIYDSQEKGKPQDITGLVNEVSALLQSWG